MIEIKLYKSPRRAVNVLVLTVPFVLMGVWMITTTSDLFERVVGCLSICFFGLGLPIGLFHLFDRRPQILINEIGIWDRTTNQGIIKWEYILDAYVIKIYSQKFIALVLDENFETKVHQYKWAARLSEDIGAQKVNLSLSLIKIDAEKLSAFIILMSNGKSNKAELLRTALSEWS